MDPDIRAMSFLLPLFLFLFCLSSFLFPLLSSSFNLLSSTIYLSSYSSSSSFFLLPSSCHLLFIPLLTRLAVGPSDAVGDDGGRPKDPLPNSQHLGRDRPTNESTASDRHESGAFGRPDGVAEEDLRPGLDVLEIKHLGGTRSERLFSMHRNATEFHPNPWGKAGNGLVGS